MGSFMKNEVVNLLPKVRYLSSASLLTDFTSILLDQPQDRSRQRHATQGEAAGLGLLIVSLSQLALWFMAGSLLAVVLAHLISGVLASGFISMSGAIVSLLLMKLSKGDAIVMGVTYVMPTMVICASLAFLMGS